MVLPSMNAKQFCLFIFLPLVILAIWTAFLVGLFILVDKVGIGQAYFEDKARPFNRTFEVRGDGIDHFVKVPFNTFLIGALNIAAPTSQLAKSVSKTGDDKTKFTLWNTVDQTSYKKVKSLLTYRVKQDFVLNTYETKYNTSVNIHSQEEIFPSMLTVYHNRSMEIYYEYEFSPIQFTEGTVGLIAETYDSNGVSLLYTTTLCNKTALFPHAGACEATYSITNSTLESVQVKLIFQYYTTSVSGQFEKLTNDNFYGEGYVSRRVFTMEKQPTGPKVSSVNCNPNGVSNDKSLSYFKCNIPLNWGNFDMSIAYHQGVYNGTSLTSPDSFWFKTTPSVNNLHRYALIVLVPIAAFVIFAILELIIVVTLIKCFWRKFKTYYDPLEESLPKVVLFIVLALVAILVATSVVVAVLAAPKGEQSFSMSHDIDEIGFYNGTSFFNHTVTNIKYQNIEFQYTVQLKANNSYTGLSKDDVIIIAHLYGRDSDNAAWKLLNSKSKDRQYRRAITCSQNDVFEVIYNPGDELRNPLKVKEYICKAITVFHQRSLNHKQYMASISFKNLGTMYNRGLFIGNATTTYKMTSQSFSAFEMAFRYSYALLTLFHFIGFVVITAMSQRWKKWHTTQKWLVFILFLSIWYHDPLFAGQVYTGTWVFPFIESVLSLAFIFGFLLYLLIFFHSLFKPPAQRTIIGFYLTKIVLVGVIYILTNILIIWSRLFNSADPAKNSIKEVPGYLYLQSVVIGLLVVYGIDLLYYVFKAAGVIRKMRTKYSLRFWAVASFSILVVLSFLGVLITQSGFRYTSQALGFLVSHTIIYLYFAVLSILFLPGFKEEDRPVTGTVVPDEGSSQMTATESALGQDTTGETTASTTKYADTKEAEMKSQQTGQPMGSDQIRVTFANYEED